MQTNSVMMYVKATDLRQHGKCVFMCFLTEAGVR